MGKTEQWNVPQSLAIAKAFYFLNHAGKACLLPFLTLYFRLLGLSATQVGIICGTRAFIGLWAAPLWAKMAKKYNVRRIVILFALFMTIACTLSLTVIPPIDEDYTLKFCQKNHTDSSEETGKVTGLLQGSLQGSFESNTSSDVVSVTEEPIRQTVGVENANTSNGLANLERHENSSQVGKNLSIPEERQQPGSEENQPDSEESRQPNPDTPFNQNSGANGLPEGLVSQETSIKEESLTNGLIDGDLPRQETDGMLSNMGSSLEELDASVDDQELFPPPESFFVAQKDNYVDTDSIDNAAHLLDDSSSLKEDLQVRGWPQSTLSNLRLPTEKRSKYEELYQLAGNLDTKAGIEKPSRNNYFRELSETGDYSQYADNSSPVEDGTNQDKVSKLLDYLLTKYQDSQPEIRERLVQLRDRYAAQVPDVINNVDYNEAYEDFDSAPYYNKRSEDRHQKSPDEFTAHKKSTYHKAGSNRQKRAPSLIDGLKSIVHELKVEILPLQYRTFLIVLTVIIIGELLTSQVEKICDDSLYEFLDNLDDIEKYGQQKYWSSLGIAICATGVAALVDNTDCFLNQGINHFMIHFYTFSGVVGLAFLLALFYPIHPVCKEHNQRKISKSFRLLLTDCRNICYLVTVFVAGALAASIHNYLFWLVQDKGGSELIMGLSVTVSTCAEIPMMFLGNWLIKRVTHAGLVSVAFLGLSVRFLYYSFLWTPWAVVPIELLHSFSYGAFWGAIMGYAEHISPPGIERTVQAIIAAIYWGLGFGTGSMVSGVIYDKYGVTTLYRAACVVSVIWCLGFVLFQRFAPRKAKMNYSRLLRQTKSNIRVDNTVSSDDDEDKEDDWLERALRETEKSV